MFQDRLLDPSSKVKQPEESCTPWPLKLGPTGYPETLELPINAVQHSETEKTLKNNANSKTMIH